VEFPETMTTSRNIPKCFWEFFTESFFSNSFPSGIFYSPVFTVVICLLEILQFLDFLTTLRGNFHTICTRFKFFGMNLLEWKAFLKIRFSSDDIREVILKLTTDAIGHFRILGSGLELVYNGGSCGGILLKRQKCPLQLKRLPALASVAS